MLDDGAVDREFVLRRAPTPVRRRGFGNQGFEDGVYDTVVPVLSLAVVVGCGGCEGGVAGVVADLSQACC